MYNINYKQADERKQEGEKKSIESKVTKEEGKRNTRR